MRFTHKGAELFYDDIGDGTPVLCLSAFPFDHRMWHEQHTLTNVARLLLPDYRGIGCSTSTDEPYTMELLADDMAELFDHAGIECAVLLGDSMGVYVAFALLERHPERIRGLIISDSRAEADTPEQAARRAHTAEGLRVQGVTVLRSRIDDLFAATTKRERPALVEAMQTQVEEMNAEGLAWLTMGMALRPDRRAMLPTIQTPILLLCGEEDTVSPPQGMQEMAKAIPNATFHLIPGAGHLAPLENPAVFNTYVREFLTRL